MRLPGKQQVTVLVALCTVLLLSASGLAMDDFPEEVALDALADLYEPVIFDHGLHVEVAEDCSVCHHHTTGTEPVNSYCLKCHAGSEEGAVVACQDCHRGPGWQNPTEQQLEFAFHDDQPNLKGAYHLSCLGCHREVGGPVGCEDCHAKTEAGEKFYYSGTFAPQPHQGRAH